MYQISIDNLNTLFEKIAATRSLYMPVKKNDQVNFHKWEEGTEYCQDELKTVKSAKDLFFPQSENIVAFKKEGKKISIETGELPADKFVLFGVRACDEKSFEILDKVFLSEPADQFYKARRLNGIVVTTACGAPEETCFCTVFGINPAEPKGDITTWIAEGKLYWQANSEAGKAFTEEIKDVFTDGDDSAVEAQKKQIAEILEKLPLTGLSLEGWNGDVTMEKFNQPQWEELSEACLGCGTCTFVCPTCQCYDVRDYDTGHGIQRFRCWDSCMYNDFTMMAHGTNRPTQLQRFRQRFMHKLVYFPANNDGEYSCVGCGRCVSKCPISMNIAKVIKAFGGDKK